ncbi:hypothetical protein JWG45_15965 [Leptospira sp. 201903070]|uniref:Uncharacterized protein n=1 Tax=Leptospira ainlahdjerensis TaxID=2810033 RepID=A0ABS2UHA8_9LEPT|nr:hypothetical protein [Leptospira ainlahdjerensis]MBM9578642.1 hypothetical protein [Leptospira ainlahdjerensis]
MKNTLLLINLSFHIFTAVDASECVRSKPISTIKSNSPFKVIKLSKEEWIYKEQIEIDSNTKVIIENKGCESYWIEYQILLSNLEAQVSAYNRLIEVIKIISKLNKSSINLIKVSTILRDTNETKIYKDENRISENEFGEYFTLTKKKYKDGSVQFTLSAEIGL